MPPCKFYILKENAGVYFCGFFILVHIQPKAKEWKSKTVNFVAIMNFNIKGKQKTGKITWTER